MGGGGCWHPWRDETRKEATFWKAPAGHDVLKVVDEMNFVDAAAVRG